jgi:hypothetical protein
MYRRDTGPLMDKTRAAIAKRDLSAYDLEKVLCVGLKSCRPYLQLLHSMGEIHIVEWLSPARNGKRVPVYRNGPGEDLKKPQPVTDAARQKQHRKKLKTLEAEGYVLNRTNRRALRTDLEHLKQSSDPLTQLLILQGSRQCYSATTN